MRISRDIARPCVSFVVLFAWSIVACARPAGAQVSTKPGGAIHGRMTHVDRHPGRHCRDARGRFVRCVRKSRPG